MNNLKEQPGLVSPILALEEFRIIKRRLLEPDPSGKPRGRTILITSALDGEGKSFIALNLALSLSSGGEMPVTLVDGDWHRRSLASHFGFGTAPGLAELLGDETIAAETLLRPTAVPRLALLPPGEPVRPAGELSGVRLARRIAELEQLGGPSGLTIVDTPAVLASAEAALWAPHVGRVLLVVQSRRAPRHLLQHTLSIMQACPDVECILNLGDTDVHGLAGYG